MDKAGEDCPKLERTIKKNLEVLAAHDLIKRGRTVGIPASYGTRQKLKIVLLWTQKTMIENLEDIPPGVVDERFLGLEEVSLEDLEEMVRHNLKRLTALGVIQKSDFAEFYSTLTGRTDREKYAAVLGWTQGLMAERIASGGNNGA
jgi:hypothetical protein